MDSSNFKKHNKIIWFLIGNPVFTASSRIHGLAVHQELVRLGYNSFIAYLPEFTEEEIPFNFSRLDYFDSLVQPGDIIILQKIKGQVNLPLLHYFKQLELKLVLIDCDLPIADEIGKVADLIVCTSKTLRDLYIQKGMGAIYIEDCPEWYFNEEAETSKGKLECYWFGDNTTQKWNEVLWLQELMKDSRLSNWKLITLSNHPSATIQWSPDFLDTLKQADVVAIPASTNDEESGVKSANRLLQSMALSVPVVCSPLPSYTDVITSGIDGFICGSKEEWVNAFQQLENDIVRKEMRKKAYEKAQKFSLDKSIEVWMNAFELSEKFKYADTYEHSATQVFLSNFFYKPLLKKNLNYWKKMSFSVKNTLWLFYCVLLKIKKRFIR